MRYSRAGFVSRVGMFVGLAVTVLAVFLIWANESPHYWPLLVTGLVIGCASAPSYYYYKAKDKAVDRYADTGVQALNALGQQLSQQKHNKDNKDNWHS